MRCNVIHLDNNICLNRSSSQLYLISILNFIVSNSSGDF